MSNKLKKRKLTLFERLDEAKKKEQARREQYKPLGRSIR
jgi:hypothetical protein